MQALLNNYLIKDLSNIVLDFLKDYYIICNNMNDDEYTLLITMDEINLLMEKLNTPLESKRYSGVSSASYDQPIYTHYRIVPSKLDKIQSIISSVENQKKELLKRNENYLIDSIRRRGEKKGGLIRHQREGRKKHIDKIDYTQSIKKLFS